MSGGGRDTVSEAWGAGADAKASEDSASCSRCASSAHKAALTLIRGAPAAGDFLLRRQKKVTKEKATPVRSLPLRSSAKPGAAQLALRAQISVRARRSGLGLA